MTLIDRHEDMDFNEEKHVYTRNSKQYTSVTTLISSYHEHFNAEAIATKLAKGDEVKKAVLKYQWARSSPWGTYIHRLLELYTLGTLQDSPSLMQTEEPVQFTAGAEIYQELLDEGWRLFKPELRVWDEEFMLCGTVDLVMINDKNELLLGDWKTCKNIPKTGFMGKKMFSPLAHFDDCKLLHYSLQLSIYKRLIEKNTDFKVVQMELFHLPEDGKPKRISVNYCEDIELILKPCRTGSKSEPPVEDFYYIEEI